LALISILHRSSSYAAKFREKYSFREPYSHVQSMMFVMDYECMSFLKQKGFFARGNENTQDDVIINHEILLSQEVLYHGWNISSLLPEYKNVDYRTVDDDVNPSSRAGDPCFTGGYFHRSLHPLETIFFKTNRGLIDLRELAHLGNPAASTPKIGKSPEIATPVDDILERITSAWTGHKNFSLWLASRLQSRTIVDLGVDYGYSSFCFGLACPDGHVYAIDSFEGDDQTGFRNTFKEISKTCERLGLRNVTIIPEYFDAVARTWGRPIDILHIDGNHTYEAVKGDYLAWSKFVKPSGVVLFHDTCVAHFGVRRLFDEIALPKVNFTNSHGLGVLSQDRNLIEEIARTFECLIEPGSLQLSANPIRGVSERRARRPWTRRWM
jgi:hypothetical protein